MTAAGEFRVTGFPETFSEIPDNIAPSRITDLHISLFDPGEGKAVLEWTAVGDDMDRGKGISCSMTFSDGSWRQ